MKKTLLLIICLAISNLSGCAIHTKSIIKNDLPLSAVQKRNTLIGKWFGEMKSENGEIQRWLADRSKDGTYKIEFRIYKSGNETMSQVEVGHWGVAGPIYFSITRGWIKNDKFIPSDPENPYFYDVYKIVKLTDQSFIYYSFDEDLEFEVRKIDDTFQWPEIGS